MTYEAMEDSAAAGAPVELYAFATGTTRHLYCTAEAAVSYSSESYQPANIERDAIDHAAEINKQSLSIRVPRDSALVKDFISAVPTRQTTLTIFRNHRGDTEFSVIWKGRITGVSFNADTAEVRCEPVFTSLKRAGLRAYYQTLCRHVLYGPACRLGAAAFTVAGTVAYASGTSVNVDAAATKPDGWFVGGRIRAGDHYRMVIGHAGIGLTLSAPIPDLKADVAVELTAGCDHTPGACHNKFGNLDNYGGFPYIPAKSPFSGDAIV